MSTLSNKLGEIALIAAVDPRTAAAELFTAATVMLGFAASASSPELALEVFEQTVIECRNSYTTMLNSKRPAAEMLHGHQGASNAEG